MIEQDYNNADVVFHYSKNNHQRANKVITTLPLFVERVFGKAVAQEWITEEAWTLVENYQVTRINPKDGLQGVRITNNKDDKWDDSSDSKYGDLGFEEVNDKDGEILITNFDLVKLDTCVTYILGDSGQSTASRLLKDEAKANTPSLVTTETTDDTSSITTNTRDIQVNVQGKGNENNDLQVEDLTNDETNDDLLQSILKDSKSK